ncbi:major facilitator superfamily transporter [Seiridium cupressi]
MAEKDSVEDVEFGRPKELPDTLGPSSQPAHVDLGAERALRWRQDKRIIPLSAGIYFLCYLDRSNIGNAKIMNSATHNDLLTETGMSNYQYTIALMVFLVAYGLFEFLLGVFEAGLFPGLVYYLTFWYTSSERSLRVAFILASATLAGAFGGAIAYGVGHMNQAGGLSAWRWLFIIEGAPSCLSALAVWLLLPDYPEDVKWLTAAEKTLAANRLRLEGSKGHDGGMKWADAKATLGDLRLWGHYLGNPSACFQILALLGG